MYTFYYSPIHGAGINVSQKYDPLRGEIIYEDGTRADEDLTNLTVLVTGGGYFEKEDEDLFNHAGTKNYNAWRKGIQIFQNGGVTARNRGGKISFLVEDGSKEHIVSILKSSYGSVDMICDCKSWNCCHIAACCELFKTHIRKLKQLYLEQKGVDHSLFLGPDMEEKLQEYISEDALFHPAVTVQAVRETVALIRKVGTESYFGGLLDKLFSRSPSWGYESTLLAPFAPLFTAMYLDPLTGPWIKEEKYLPYLQEYPGRQYKSNASFFRKIIKEAARFEKERSKGTYSENPIAEFALKFLESNGELLAYYADIKTYLDQDDIPELLKMAAAFGAQDFRQNSEKDRDAAYSSEKSMEKLTPSAVEAVKKILIKLDGTRPDKMGPDGKNRAMSALMSLLEPKEATVFLEELNTFKIDLPMYKTFDPETQKRLMTKMGPEPETVAYILEYVLPGAEDQEKAAYVFSALERCRGTAEVKAVSGQLESVLDSLPENGLLKTEVAYRYEGFGDNETFNRLHSRLKKQSLTPKRPEVIRYYRGSWDLEEADGGVVVIHYLFPPGDVKGACIVVYEYQDGNLYGDKLAMLFSKESVKELVEINRTAFGTAIDEAAAAKREEILAREFAKTNKGFARDYDELLEELARDKIIFTESYKAGLKYQLTDENGKLLLAFRIGNVKDYIVKNAFEFLDCFRKRETVTYGKDLLLTHDLENMQPEDQPVLRMLTAMKFTQPPGDVRQKRFLPVKGAMLANLLEMLAGRNIEFLETDCLVRLEEKEIRVRINENCELEVTPELKNSRFYASDGKGFLFTQKNGSWTVDRIRGNQDEISFLLFAAEHGGISIRPILPDFKKQLYSRFFDIVDVAPSLEQQFKLSEVRINVYFDYDDKAVTCREELLREEKTIARSELKERIDLEKLFRFDAFLGQLGFEAGKICEEGKVLNFFKTDFSDLKKIAGVYLSESLSRKSIVAVSRQKVKITCKGNLMEAVLEKSEFSEAELEKILQALRRKKKYLLLSGDRLVDLDSGEAREFAETVKELGLEPGRLYKKKQLAMVNALKAFAHENNCSIDRHLRQMIEEIRTFREAELKPPALELAMRPYQEEGFRWMHILARYGLGGILADDMGLGKTVQIIALLTADKTEKPDLIVCPKSLVFNWINEFARFSPETETVEIYGPPAQRSRQIDEIDYGRKKVYITSYDSLRNDIGSYTGEFRYCILDEAQFIKNSNAQKSQSAKEIRALHRFALTGTPIENTVEDLWSIFDFLMPGYFEELSEFRTASRQEDFPKRIAAQIAPFVLRRVKENVLADLPQKYERILSTEMTAPQRALYDALRLKANRMLEETGKAFDILPYLMHLRQICVDPAMYAEDYDGKSGKMAHLEEMIPQYLAEGHRILLFSQFVKGLNQVEKLLQRSGIPYFMLTGDTEAKKRAEMIQEFNSTLGTDVFLISLKAGGTGLNLTGADTVIHLDPWWNTAAENQATDRAHRIGQTRNVEVIKLIADQSIEQRVIELQNKKKSLIDQIISDDENSVINASLEDIRFVLQ